MIRRVGAGRRGMRSGGAGSLAWTPAQLASLTSWFRADVGVTQAASLVSAWADQSGAGLNPSMTASGAPQPGFSSNGINGGPSITFNGSQALFGSATPLGTTALTAFAVLKTSSGGPIYAKQYNHFNYNINVMVGLGSYITADDTTAQSATYVSDGNAHVIISTWSTADNTARVYVDGTTVGGTTATSATALSSNGDINAVGTLSNAPGTLYGSYTGQAAQVGSCNAVLTGAQLTSLWTYLRGIAGI